MDAVARDIIDAAGHGEHFGHGLGHGVGLEIHEAPRLGKTAEGSLVAGNAVTVEPGVYLPGDVGVRIEDLVIVTDGEPRRPDRLPEGPRHRRLMALAALAAFAGAAVQSATGMGFALVLSPALFAVMDPEEAVTAVLLLGAALCVLVLLESRRVAAYGLGRLLVPAVPGLLVGWSCSRSCRSEALQVGVGVAVIAAAAWQLRHRAAVPRSRRRRRAS